MSNEWDKCIAQFRENLEREIGATPTGDHRNLLTEINLQLMQVQDVNKAARESVNVGGN